MSIFDSAWSGISASYEGLAGLAGDVVGKVTGTEKANELNQQMAQQSQKWTQENMATAFGYDQTAYKQSLADQTNLANTAHQREVADLKAAGLNPILSGTGGSGASTPSVKMDTPGAMPGATGNQGMRGPDVLGAATEVMSGINSAKELKQTSQNIENLKAAKLGKDYDNMQKSLTLGPSISADNAENDARKAAAERDLMYTQKDMKNPNMNYWLNKAGAGGAANSAKTATQIGTILMRALK